MRAFLSAGMDAWIRGLIAAFISGGSGAVTSAFSVSIEDPKDWNTQHPLHLLHLMGTAFLISGALGAFLYLKQSPVPVIQAQPAPEAQKAASA